MLASASLRCTLCVCLLLAACVAGARAVRVEVAAARPAPPLLGGGYPAAICAPYLGATGCATSAGTSFSHPQTPWLAQVWSYTLDGDVKGVSALSNFSVYGDAKHPPPAGAQWAVFAHTEPSLCGGRVWWKCPCATLLRSAKRVGPLEDGAVQALFFHDVTHPIDWSLAVIACNATAPFGATYATSTAGLQ